MSNIHTLDEIKKAQNERIAQQRQQQMAQARRGQQAPPPKQDDNPFKGQGRRLDGTVVEPEPEPKVEKQKKKNKAPNIEPLPDGDFAYQQEVVILAADDVPPELKGSLWSYNNPENDEVNFCNVCLLSYAPCCVGPCCSETRKKDWCKILTLVTFWLIIAQIVVYGVELGISNKIGTLAEPSVSAVVKMGAISTYDIVVGHEYWRYITYMFLHGSIFHIIFNTLALFMSCLNYEKSWGYLKYWVIYILSGIIGGFFSASRSTNAVSVGASCAIFGVMGAYAMIIIIYWSTLSNIARVQLGMSLIMVPILFVIVSFLPNVDILGHLGGLLGGVGLGLVIFHGKAPKLNWLYLVIGIIVLLASVLTPLLITFLR